MHHKYKVEVIGTFGGTTSGMLQPGEPPFNPFVKILNRGGALIGGGETSTLDPFGPSFCYLTPSPCYVGYVFRWQNGVETNLGALPENPASGRQTPCTDCAWSSFAYGIADNGFVVGESEDNSLDSLTGAPTSLAVLWKEDGQIVNLGTLGGNESAAAAVNDRGDVVGAALTSTPDPFPGRCPMVCDFFIFGNGTEPHAFLWRDGRMQDLGTLGGPDSGAFFVNDLGDIAGASDVDYTVNPVTQGPTVHPFVWRRGQMLDLVAVAPPGMFGGTYGIVSALNDRGQVAGTMNLSGDTTWHSFLWQEGSITDLGTLGGINTTAEWMNRAGHVVGRSDVTAICSACSVGNQQQLHHPFLWRDNTITDLGLLYDDTAGTAYNINDKDQVIGITKTCTAVEPNDACEGQVSHAFLWENGSIVDLQSLLIPSSDVTLDCPTNGPFGCVGAYNINDRGEIAAQGVLANGETRALLLIPCDGNHPDLDGCEYDMVDVTATPQSGKSAAKAKMTQGVYAPTRNPWIRRGGALRQ
jgi:probable HAF family extracellular repeat protein